jgi:putative ABC transport system permease protein
VLSLFGVTIGIFSIIFVLSIVDSMEADMKEGLSVMGSDLLFIQKWPMGPEKDGGEYEWWNYWQRRQPSKEDLNLLKADLKSFSVATIQVRASKTVEHENNSLEGVGFLGVGYDYIQAIDLKIEKGRYFSQMECDGGRPVALIGYSLAEQLFGAEYPVGQDIKIQGQKAEVIGVMAKEGSSLFGGERDLSVYVPYEYAQRFASDVDDVTLLIKAKKDVDVDVLKGDVMSVFRGIRGIRPTEDNDFSVIDSSMISDMVNSIVGVFNVAGMFIGIFAILVGAFSIANIMFVSVKERTNIIGIQKALGAKRYFILSQFLFESILLCLVGGIMGLLLVWGVLSLLNSVTEFHFFLPFSRIMLGITVSLVVGIVAGFIPALRAANLKPVDAIRSAG